LNNDTLIFDHEIGAILRNDLSSFIERTFYELNPCTNFLPATYIDLMAATLEKCCSGEIKRLIINLPPRMLKSHAASVAFPAWLLGRDPAKQIICASYGQDLADKHARDCRTLMRSDFYRRLFPGTALSEAKQSVNEFMTTQQGFRLATSVGGAVTGRGADMIILDDIVKPEEALSETRRPATNHWFFNTLFSRLNSKEQGVIIIVMQRLHQEDLVGEVLDRGHWEVLSLPAIAVEDERILYKNWCGEFVFVRQAGQALHPERESKETLLETRKNMGEYEFQSQYQQSPTAREGSIVKREWLKYYPAGPTPREYWAIVQSWDTAIKAGDSNDFSVCTTWMVAGGNAYLLDVFRERLIYPDLKRAVIEQFKRHTPGKIIIEDQGSGSVLIEDLKRDGLYCEPYKPPSGTSKADRLGIQSSKFEAGLVYLPEKASWRDAYIDEITGFPGAKHDDQVDSTTQALDYLTKQLELSKPGDGRGFFYPQRGYETY
jgi:predicted phage terminase large subunit-like protein